MPDGTYRVGGTYYLKLASDSAEVSLREMGDHQELIVALPQSSESFEISYALLW